MTIPIRPEGVPEVIIVDDSNISYGDLFGSSVEVHTITDTTSFEQLLASHDDPNRIGAILLSGIFPAEPQGKPVEQWQQVLDILERFEASREGVKIPVTPFSDSAALNQAIYHRLERAHHPILVENDAMLYSRHERIVSWLANVIRSSH